MNNIVKEDFYAYFNAGLRVIPLENGKSLIPMWDSLKWAELPPSEVIIDSWFKLYGDRINGIGLPLGEDHNQGYCCIKIESSDLGTIERLHVEFNPKVSCYAGKNKYLFFENIYPLVDERYLFPCPSGGKVKVLYSGYYAILPPSYHSDYTHYQWSDEGFSTLLNTPLDKLGELSKISMQNIGDLINTPSIDSLNANLPNDEQYKGRLRRKEKIDAYMEKIYDRNPNSSANDTTSQILDYDAINFPNASFFLGDTWKSVNREANALIYVAAYNAEFSNQTGQGATFDNKVENDQVIFNKLVPVDEAHTRLDDKKFPEFDMELVPHIWRHIINEHYDKQGVPPHALFMAMMTSLGAAMQGNLIIQPDPLDPSFYRRTNLATTMVASSGSKKSDVIRIATAELAKISELKRKRNSREDLIRVFDLEKRIETLTKEKNKPDADKDALNDEIFKLQDELDKNPLKGTKFIYGQATVQKMILDAKGNQDTGLFMIVDEMKQLFANMKKKGNEDYRLFYMEGFDGNGRGFSYTTVGRGEDYIEKHFLSLLTAIQPDPLSVFIKELYSAYGANDGFLQRIIMIPFGPVQPIRPRRIDQSKFKEAYEIFNTVHYHASTTIHVREDCMDLYEELKHEIKIKASRYAANEPLSSMLFKHEGFLCVLATAYEALMTGKMPIEIGEESLRMAMRLLDYIGECAKYLFEVKDRQEDQAAIVEVANMLKHKHFRNGATQSEWFQSVRGTYRFPSQFYNALRELELRGYVAMKGNKVNSITCYINPEVNLL